jgi:8-oxo-dGTP pyrophosphatase MutT (NUDIX family)
MLINKLSVRKMFFWHIYNCISRSIFVTIAKEQCSYLTEKIMHKGIDYPGINVTYLCHDGTGRFVMALRSERCRDEHHKWDIGGGGIETGDSIEETLRREIKEEYGADVLGFEFLGIRELFRIHQGKKTHWIALDYKVLVDANQVKNGEPHKFDKVHWFTLQTLPLQSDCHSGLALFLEKNKDKLGL